ncbi:MAG TPA: hypothetical protein PKD83_09700 [Ignavibacteria bacterium]|nr:hypothetical protein [Ignavibacteria bacterium]
MKNFKTAIIVVVIMFCSSVNAQENYKGQVMKDGVIWYVGPGCSYYEPGKLSGSDCTDSFYEYDQSDFSENQEYSESEDGSLYEETDISKTMDDTEEDLYSESENNNTDSENISELYLGIFRKNT